MNISIFIWKFSVHIMPVRTLLRKEKDFNLLLIWASQKQNHWIREDNQKNWNCNIISYLLALQISNSHPKSRAILGPQACSTNKYQIHLEHQIGKYFCDQILTVKNNSNMNSRAKPGFWCGTHTSYKGFPLVSQKRQFHDGRTGGRQPTGCCRRLLFYSWIIFLKIKLSTTISTFISSQNCIYHKGKLCSQGNNWI